MTGTGAADNLNLEAEQNVIAGYSVEICLVCEIKTADTLNTLSVSHKVVNIS